MAPTLSPDPVKVRAGKAGAARRWGPGPRIIRLDDMPPEQRAFIAELVDVYRRNEAPTAPDAP